MRFLTAAECASEVKRLGIEVDPVVGPPGTHRDSVTAELMVPKHCGQQAHIINVLFDEYRGDASLLLWLRDWGIFMGEEYPEIWLAIRERYGERRPIIEAPGHLFSSGERGLARGMARLAMLFGWDADLICDPVSSIQLISLTHDGAVWIVAEANIVGSLQSKLPGLQAI
jgi:hypothetical protein